MRKVITSAALLAAVLVAPSAVFAADSYDRSEVGFNLPGYVFNKFDADNNGLIEGDERQRAILFKQNDQMHN